MGPKKKGKANKLAKMSDEERARYLQHRADIEEEARRRKQELISRYMKNKLNKEDVFSKINLAKINQSWRFILRKLKVKDMDQELQLMISCFTRTVDSKNAVISRLMTSLDESEDQYSRMLQSHMEMISHFLFINADRLKFFHDNFEQQKDELIERWEEELQSIEYNHKESEYNIRLVIFQQEENIEQYMKKTTTSKARMENAMKNSLEQDFNVMKMPKQLELEKIWNDIRAVFTNYVEYHSPKIEQYKKLRQKDSMYRKEISQHVDQLLVAGDIIAQLQREYENTKEDSESHLQNLRKKRDEMNVWYSHMKMYISENSAKDRENFAHLSVESSNAIRKLEGILTKIKKIVQMETTCRKYEIEGEKVLPWNYKDLQIQTSSVLDELTDDVQSLDRLENFWFNVKRVTVHAAALRAECDNLKQENRHLKDCLKNILMEAALGDLKGSNAEIAGRPSSMRMYNLTSTIIGSSEPVGKRPVTCIEGSTCNAVQHARRLNKWKSAHMETQKVIVRKYCW